MTPEEELGKTLDQLIYDYDACDSPIADLLRELKEARPDARRYRWLRKAGAWESELGIDALCENPMRFDAAVDAAMETK